MPKKVTKAAVADVSDKDLDTNKYELMFILQPELRESEVNKKLKEFEEAFEKMGKITERDFWGKRKLAYSIRRFEEGIYMVYNLDVAPSHAREINEMMRIDKDVIRHLFICLPNSYKYTKYDLDAVVSVKPEGKKDADIEGKGVRVKKERKTETATEEKGKAPDAEAVSKKLDEIIGGSDLKL